MSVEVNLSNELYESAVIEGNLHDRTAQEQIEFWIKVGRTAIANPDLSTLFIADVLVSLAEPREQGEIFRARSNNPL
jgi:hypothetical protein